MFELKKKTGEKDTANVGVTLKTEDNEANDTSNEDEDDEQN